MGESLEQSINVELLNRQSVMRHLLKRVVTHLEATGHGTGPLAWDCRQVLLQPSETPKEDI